MFDFFKRKKPETPPPAPVQEPPRRMKIRPESVGRNKKAKDPFRPAKPPKGVVPKGAPSLGMATDEASNYAAYFNQAEYWDEDLQWLGYPLLTALAQRSEYRTIVETYAREMTRQWIKLTTTGDEDKSEKIAELTKALEAKYHVRDVIRMALETDGYYGRAHIYVDIGDDSAQEVGTILIRKAVKLKNRLKGFKIVEPLWTYPAEYNAIDPLSRDFYRPTSWYVNGKRVHATRLLTMVARDVPNALKPAYSFGGISLTQMARPYVDNWLRSRQSVSDLLHSYSKDVLKTNMSGILNDGAADSYLARAALYNNTRDNRGLIMLDKTDEDFVNVSTPLSTVDKILAQSQEQMASVAQIPLIILLGITPTGLNASAESELDVWARRIRAEQEKEIRPRLQEMIEIIQVAEFGEIDPSIGFEFVPLREMSELDEATIRKTEADTDAVYIQAGVLDPEDARNRIANDEKSLYHGVALQTPEPPEPPGGAFGDDEDDEDGPPAQDGDKWITIHPNGPDAKGMPMKIDDATGEVKAGAGGKFNGQKIGSLGKNHDTPDVKKPGGLSFTKQRIQEAHPGFNFVDSYIGYHPGIITKAAREHNVPLENVKMYRIKDGPFEHSDEWGVFVKPEGYDSFKEESLKRALESYRDRPLLRQDILNSMTKEFGVPESFFIDKYGRPPPKAEPLKTKHFSIEETDNGYSIYRADGASQYAVSSGPKRDLVKLRDTLEQMESEHADILTRVLDEGENNSFAYLNWFNEAEKRTRGQAQAQDGDWHEEDHPRAENGQFGSGGGSREVAANEKGRHKVEYADRNGRRVHQTFNSLADAHSFIRGAHSSVRKTATISQNKPTFSANHYADRHFDSGINEQSILAHFPPDTKSKITDRLQEVEKRQSTHEKYQDENGNYTPERQALHEKIIAHILSPEVIERARPPAGQKPTYFILGGRGGSGKSKFKDLLPGVNNTVYLDADEIKGALPEYEGWNAAEVHEESGDIFDEITKRSKALGLNLVHDATMKTPKKAESLVQGFKDDGYRIEAHYMHLPRQEAAKRAVERFLNSGRLVPPAIVLGNTENEKAFDLVKEMADNWSFWDNHVPRGEPPQKIAAKT